MVCYVSCFFQVVYIEEMPSSFVIRDYDECISAKHIRRNDAFANVRALSIKGHNI